MEDAGRPVILLFAKAPVAGKVKTRLMPPLDGEQAAKVHEALVGEMWVLLGELGEADRELCTDEETMAWPQAAPRRLQTSGDLGERMFAALAEALANGRPKAMIVGSDTTGLPAERLRALLRSEADVALGPAEDGGFYAICCGRVEAGMFDGVRWSTAHALADTVAGALRRGLAVQVGAPWFDIDTVKDLERLPVELKREIGWERQ
ncbi:MAG: TIGR04282 family arsenosugar biosynthesis glycosyltransferase [Bryobacterales bacterium]|nr:TIGR04282 family arsenosugar biosynthesis glycosyltransferase [Bryobacterales bacterium]